MIVEAFSVTTLPYALIFISSWEPGEISSIERGVNTIQITNHQGEKDSFFSTFSQKTLLYLLNYITIWIITLSKTSLIYRRQRSLLSYCIHGTLIMISRQHVIVPHKEPSHIMIKCNKEFKWSEGLIVPLQPFYIISPRSILDHEAS